MKTSKWIEKNIPSLEGKTVAISGATGGIGKELCRHLAALGASLVLLDRNPEKSLALKKTLQKDFPALGVKNITLDLEDIDSVRSVAESLLQDPPDALILNAGAYHIPRHKCSTGFDNVFQINFVSPYYLARTLLPKIQERGGRIVAVGSIAHTYSSANFSDIDFSLVTKSSKAYGNAKRYLMFSLFGLDEYGKTVVVAHPGITFTNITAHYPRLIFAIIKHPMKVIFMRPARACLSILYGLVTECGKNEWIGPKFFKVWGLPRRQRLSTCSDEEAAQICAIAEEIYDQSDLFAE
ncbi:MAG: SDR family NAD(P)-dependent oxidoreductase [Clostridia bacterium]|nr:SDR family NAD(P)-dependent oxidoreductase [Clostridia bacterium]